MFRSWAWCTLIETHTCFQVGIYWPGVQSLAWLTLIEIHKCFPGGHLSARWLWVRCVAPQPAQNFLHSTRRRGARGRTHWSVSLPTVSDQPVLFHCCPNKSGPGLGRSVKLAATLSPSVHTGHSCMMHFFLLKGEVPPVPATCNGLLTKDFLFFFVLTLLKQERGILQLSHCRFYSRACLWIIYLAFWKRSTFWENYFRKILLLGSVCVLPTFYLRCLFFNW